MQERRLLVRAVVLFPLFSWAAVCFAEAHAKICIVHAANGSTEESRKAVALKNADEVTRLRLRGLGVTAAGLFPALVLTCAAVLSNAVDVHVDANTVALVLSL